MALDRHFLLIYCRILFHAKIYDTLCYEGNIMKITGSFLLFTIFSFSACAVPMSTLQFRGEVNAQTCSININGTDISPIVLLPTVNADNLKMAQSVAGITKFIVNVTGCDSGAATIQTRFAGNNITVNGNLGNTGTAHNVSIQLLDADGITPLRFVNGSSVETTSFIKADSASTASQELFAQYYAEGMANPGTVNASAQYSIYYK